MAASSGEATVPVSTAICPAVTTCTCASGIAARSILSTDVMFWLTRTEAE